MSVTIDRAPAEHRADHASILTSPMPMPSICASASRPRRSATARRRREDADQRVAPAGRKREADQHAEQHAGQRHRVRQDAVFEVDEGEHEQHGRETRRTSSSGPGPNTKRAARTPRRSAARPADSASRRAPRRTATAAQQEPAHDRHVVVPAQGLAAPRAMRGRMDDRLAQRDPVDADVEEAADRQADQDEARRRAPAPAAAGHGERHRPPAATAIRSAAAPASTVAERDLAASTVEREDEAVRVGGNDTQVRRPHERPPRSPARRRRARDTRHELPQRVHCPSRRAAAAGGARPSASTRSRRTRRAPVQQPRRAAVAALASVLAASGLRNQGAPGSRLPRSNHSAALL